MLPLHSYPKAEAAPRHQNADLFSLRPRASNLMVHSVNFQVHKSDTLMLQLTDDAEHPVSAFQARSRSCEFGDVQIQ